MSVRSAEQHSCGIVVGGAFNAVVPDTTDNGIEDLLLCLRDVSNAGCRRKRNDGASSLKITFDELENRDGDPARSGKNEHAPADSARPNEVSPLDTDVVEQSV